LYAKVRGFGNEAERVHTTLETAANSNNPAVPSKLWAAPATVRATRPKQIHACLPSCAKIRPSESQRIHRYLRGRLIIDLGMLSADILVTFGAMIGPHLQLLLAGVAGAGARTQSFLGNVSEISLGCDSGDGLFHCRSAHDAGLGPLLGVLCH